LVVRNGCPRGAESKPPAGALAAARDGPGDGSAAAGAQGLPEHSQARAAARAEDVGRDPAAGAAAWEEQIEERASNLRDAGTPITHENVDIGARLGLQ
jgi:hypothetical protein